MSEGGEPTTRRSDARSNNGDLVCIGNIDEDATSVARELESFRVGRERYVRNLRTRGWVDDGKRASSVTHHDLARASIDADVICVFTEVGGAHWGEIIGTEKCD